MDAPCAPAEERPAFLFPIAPAHRPSFFSSLSLQEFVDVSNQIYIYDCKKKAHTDRENDFAENLNMLFHWIIFSLRFTIPPNTTAAVSKGK
ncbi:hypothetical protein AM501_01480 [Aneurinibacillus migulanus]|nr:hypothetical protein TS64_24035 [Aneurinibacillus migulanus]KPD09922.1 hypothetical protein AM501_01480 [Aneurinibacillus migulanus]